MSMTVTLEARPSRAEINRRNAQKSTGPRSAVGKARVKFNALKHGLRARTPILPGEDQGAYQARLDAWTDELQPRGEVEHFLVARAVHASWQLERVDRAREARREAARYADADRLAARAEEVVALGRRLFWDSGGPLCLYPHPAPADGEPFRVSDSGVADDPDDPARIVVRLEATALGCAWLLERWGELRELLEDGLAWLPPDRLKAVRLLGRQPLEAIDDLRVMAIYLGCWALEPAGAIAFSDLIGELAPKERAVYLERLNARVPPFGRPEDPEAARAALLALVAGEEERLEEVLSVHLEREEAEARADQAFDGGAWAERLRKYEQSNDRMLVRNLETLRKRRQEADGTTPPGGRASARPVDANHPVVPAVPPAVDATPEEIEAPGGLAAMPAGPAEAAPPEAAGDIERRADDLTEEEIRARALRIAEMFGLDPAILAPGTEDGGTEVPGPTSADREPRPAEVPPSSERGPRHRAIASDRPVASARRPWGAVPALLATLVLAGLPAAAAWSPLNSPATDPGRPTGRSLARASSQAPTSSGGFVRLERRTTLSGGGAPAEPAGGTSPHGHSDALRAAMAGPIASGKGNVAGS